MAKGRKKREPAAATGAGRKPKKGAAKGGKKRKTTAKAAAPAFGGWGGPTVTITYPAHDGDHVNRPLTARGTVSSAPLGMSASIDSGGFSPLTDLSWSYAVPSSPIPASATHEYLLTVQAWDRHGPGPPAYRWFYVDS
jgi:hypothetical protein